MSRMKKGKCFVALILVLALLSEGTSSLVAAKDNSQSQEVAKELVTVTPNEQSQERSEEPDVENDYVVQISGDTKDYVSADHSITMKYCDKGKINISPKVEQEEVGQYSVKQLMKAYSSGESDFVNDCSTNYAFQQLDKLEKPQEREKFYLSIMNLLDNLYHGTENVQKSDFDGKQYYCIGNVNFIELGLSADDVLGIYMSVLYDHPLYYYASSTVVYDGQALYLMIADEFADGSVREDYSTKITTMVKSFESSTQDMESNYAIVKYVHDTIIDTVSYAHEADGITPQDNAFVHSIAGYVADAKEIVCDGYAKTLASVLNYLDIQNMLVAGWGVKDGSETSDEKSHMWNLVQLGDGQYYFVDCTWDDTGDEKRDAYFCIGKRIYDDHSITMNGVHNNPYYMYPLPNIDKTEYFREEDVLLKVEDPKYDIIDDISYSFEDGVLTFRGRGTVGVGTAKEENPWDEYKDETTRIVFEDGITKVAEYSFDNYKNVESVELADSIYYLGGYAFYGTAVREVVLPKRLSFLHGFSHCEKLEKVVFQTPKNVWGFSHASNPFYDDPMLKEIIVPEDHFALQTMDGALVDRDGDKVLRCYPAGLERESFTVPEGVKGIGQWAFDQCDNLVNLEISEGVKWGAEQAFLDCSRLDKIVFPSSMETFGDGDGEIIMRCKNITCIENKSVNEMNLPWETIWLDESNTKYITSLSQGKARGIPRYHLRGGGHSSVVESDVRYDLISKVPINESFLDYFSIEEVINGVAGTAIVSNINYEDCTLDEFPEFIDVGGWKYIVDKKSALSKLEKYNDSLASNIRIYREEFHMDVDKGVGLFRYPCVIGKYNIATDISYSLYNEGIVDLETISEDSQYYVRAKGISPGKTTLFIKVSTHIGDVKATKEFICEIEVHGWNSGVEKTKSTCAQEGEREYTCGVCGKKKTEKIEALGHIYATEWTVDEKEGIKYHACLRDGCEEKADVSAIPTATPTVKPTALPTATPTAKPTVPPTTKPTSTPVPSPSATQTAAPTKAPINSKEQAATKIADNAFKGDRKLTEIKIDSNITEIGKNAFRNCKKLKKITLPKNVKKLGAYAFAGCKKLKTLTIKNRKLKAKDIAKNAFKGISKSTVIKVPKGKVSAYRKLFRSKGLSKKVKVKEY